jgi:hypothetical protein
MRFVEMTPQRGLCSAQAGDCGLGNDCLDEHGDEVLQQTPSAGSR